MGALFVRMELRLILKIKKRSIYVPKIFRKGNIPYHRLHRQTVQETQRRHKKVRLQNEYSHTPGVDNPKFDGQTFPLPVRVV